MQRLNSDAIVANGANGIPSVIDHLTGDESVIVMTGTRSNSDERQVEESKAKKFNELCEQDGFCCQDEMCAV